MRLKSIIFALVLCVAQLFGAPSAGANPAADKRLTLLPAEQRLVGFEDKIVVFFSVFCNHCYAHFQNGSWELIAGIDPRVKVEQWQMLRAEQGGADYEMWAYARLLDDERRVDMFSTNSAQYKLARAHFGAIFEQGVRDAATFYAIGLKTLQDAARMPFLSEADIRKSARENKASAEYISRIENALKIVEKTGTPAVVVRGKWLVNFAEINGDADLIDAVTTALQAR